MSRDIAPDILRRLGIDERDLRYEGRCEACGSVEKVHQKSGTYCGGCGTPADIVSQVGGIPPA